jgi:uncharacterized membrane protein YqjE
MGQLARTVLALLVDRFELLALETREEALRLMELVVWLVIACFLVQAGLVFLTLALAAAFPEQAVWIFGMATLLCVAGLGGSVCLLRRRLTQRPPPFAGTVAELRKDREWLSFLN